MLATCMFLATKVEECPHHIKNVVEGMRGILPGTIIPRPGRKRRLTRVPCLPEGFAYESTHIAEFEFYLLEEMDFYMILYHPYRPLSQYLTDLGLDRTLLQAGWSTVNDTYRSTLPLLYPPHMIALAVIFILVPQADLASEASQPKEAAIVEWLKTIRVDKDEVMEIVNRIMELYRDLDDYEEPLVPELLRRLKA